MTRERLQLGGLEYCSRRSDRQTLSISVCDLLLGEGESLQKADGQAVIGQLQNGLLQNYAICNGYFAEKRHQEHILFNVR